MTLENIQNILFWIGLAIIFIGIIYLLSTGKPIRFFIQQSADYMVNKQIAKILIETLILILALIIILEIIK